MAFVFLFIFLSVFVTLMLPVRVSMSAKTGTAPKYKAAFPVAANVSAGTITSSPFLTPAAKYAACRAAVPELSATAYFVPAAFANTTSNRSILPEELSCFFFLQKEFLVVAGVEVPFWNAAVAGEPLGTPHRGDSIHVR